MQNILQVYIKALMEANHMFVLNSMSKDILTHLNSMSPGLNGLIGAPGIVSIYLNPKV